MRRILPFSILNISASSHVHGVVGPPVTARPSGRREVARVAGRVIEEHEAEHEAALLVDGDEAPVADARHEVDQA